MHFDMDITFLGHSSFKIKGRDVTLITDPFDPEFVGFKFPKEEANIVTISHLHLDHSRADLVTGVHKIINGPGEYEVLGVSIEGISTFHDEEKGASRGKNTIYSIIMEGIRLVHLGDIGHKLDENTVGDLGEVDILFVPVGGIFTINSEAAVSVVSLLEPKITIPMHYQEPGLDPKAFAGVSEVDEFLKQVGKEAQRLSKLTVKKDTLPDAGQVIVLERKV